MKKEITNNDLHQIWFRWDGLDKPPRIEDKAWEFTRKLNELVFDMLSMLGNFDKETAYKLGQELGVVFTKPFLLCYYIGYELASGGIDRAEVAPYLVAATEPVDNFVLKLVETLAVKGIVSLEKGRDMAVEIAILTGEAANNICILGINYFGIVTFDKRKDDAKNKILKERNLFVIGSILTLVFAWGASYYFRSTAVMLEVPVFYDGLMFMLGLVSLVSHLVFFILAIRFSRAMRQSWWATVIYGILSFGLSGIVFIGLLLSANSKIKSG